METKRFKKIDEILPVDTLTQVQLDNLHSNHEPRVSSTFIAKSAPDRIARINLLSYNILSACSNYPEFEYPDDFEDKNGRGNRVAQRIRAISDARDIHLICLQKASARKNFRAGTDNPNVEEILSVLNSGEEKWDVLAQNDKTELAVLYNTSVFTKAKDQKKNPESLHYPTRFGSDIHNKSFTGGQLIYIPFKKNVSVYSGHIAHGKSSAKNASQNIDQAFAALAREFSGETLLLGLDANSPVADLHAGLVDNANNLVPKKFRKEHASAGAWNSTDLCLKIENGLVEQLAGSTPAPENASESVQRTPKTNLSRKKNPWFQVMNTKAHNLPVGAGMNTLTFVQALFKVSGTPIPREAIDIRLFTALRTNEKLLRIYSPKPLSLLEETGIERKFETGAEFCFYDIEFAYPGKISRDKTSIFDADGDKTFFVRVNGEVKRCSLDGSHKIGKAMGIDIALNSGLILGSIAGSAGVGALLGSFIFPLFGTAAGAIFGTFFGLASAATTVGLFGVIRKRLLGGLDAKGEGMLAGLIASAGATALGALIGSFLLPGMGTVFGAFIGLGIGVTLSSVAAWMLWVDGPRFEKLEEPLPNNIVIAEEPWSSFDKHQKVLTKLSDVKKGSAYQAAGAGISLSDTESDVTPSNEETPSDAFEARGCGSW